MTQSTIQIILGVLVVLVLVGAALLWMRRRRTEQLKSRFGSEYDRLAKGTGDEAKAQALLAEREKRVATFDIHPLEPRQRESFTVAWREVQAQFVDDPKAAVGRADSLLGEVMAARGYPVAEFDQRAADLSVGHAAVVTNYRTAHDIALRHERGDAGTEDLRQAMIHYRALFDELANEAPPQNDKPSAVRSKESQNDR